MSAILPIEFAALKVPSYTLRIRTNADWDITQAQITLEIHYGTCSEDLAEQVLTVDGQTMEWNEAAAEVPAYVEFMHLVENTHLFW